MGAVYEATSQRDETRVALKVMLSEVAVDDVARRLFLREVRYTRELGDHPNCVRFLGEGSVGPGFYLLLEFCPGGSIDPLLERLGRTLTLDEAAPLMLQALAGLSFFHERGLVHRDLKPQNILLTAADPRAGLAKVADFGLAKSFMGAGMSSGLT